MADSRDTRGGGGEIKPGDLNWLASQLGRTPTTPTSSSASSAPSVNGAGASAHAQPSDDPDSEIVKQLRERLTRLLGNFSKNASSTDEAAYNAVNAITGNALPSLVQLMEDGITMQQDLQLNGEHYAKAIQRTRETASELLGAQAEINDLRAQLFNAKDIGQGASLQTPYFSHFARTGGDFTAGSATSAASTSATSATQSVMIQGHSRSLATPLDSAMVRAFCVFLLAEEADGRNVRREALITPAARTVIRLRFRLLSEQRGFCPEFPEGARGPTEEAELDKLAEADSWIRWSTRQLTDCLVRGFPSETRGAAALGQTLEEGLREINLKVSTSDFKLLTRYL
jgi:hypothetical protein